MKRLVLFGVVTTLGCDPAVPVEEDGSTGTIDEPAESTASTSGPGGSAPPNPSTTATPGTTTATTVTTGVAETGFADTGVIGDGSSSSGYYGSSTGYYGSSTGFYGSSSTGSMDPACGNGMVDPGEQCDGEDLFGFTCMDLGSDQGELACNEDCTFDLSGCSDFCGDGTVDPGEQCDGKNVQGLDCAALGLGSGKLGCDPDLCVFDTSGCMP